MNSRSLQQWLTAAVAAALTTGLSFAQSDSGQHQSDTGAMSDADLAAQVESLKATVRQLEDQLVVGQGDSTSGAMKMTGSNGMEKGKSDMGMMKKGGMGGMSEMGSDRSSSMKMASQSGMSDGSDRMSGADMKSKGMGMMGSMSSDGSTQRMAMQSASPGSPGASHLNHIGATGFFLDHGEHIELSVDQQQELSRIKENALLGQASAERRIEEAEQELWRLTAVARPDTKAIDAKVRAIEKLRSDQRLAFILAVSESSKVLTPAQRDALTGAEPNEDPNTHTNH